MPNLPPKSKLPKTKKAQHKVDKFWNSRKWRNVRDVYRSAYPICQRCVYLGTVTNDSCVKLSVHHICKVETHEHLSLCEDNLLTLCDKCHYGHFSTLERTGKIKQAETEGKEIKCQYLPS